MHDQEDMYITQWAKTPKRESVGVFDNMALYFQCRINKRWTLSDCVFGDFAHVGINRSTYFEDDVSNC